VAVDQVVHLVERPALRERIPALLERARVTRTFLRERVPALGEGVFLRRRLALDLAEPQHVWERPSRARQVGLGTRAEVPEAER